MGLNNEGAEAIAEKLRSLKVGIEMQAMVKRVGLLYTLWDGKLVGELGRNSRWKSENHVSWDGYMVDICCFLMKYGESQSAKWMFNGDFW